VPPEVAAFIARELPIPVLGIGAGADVDGQVLIVSDVLGTFQAFTPKFVKRYADLAEVATSALREYVSDVRSGAFPEETHCYRMLDGEHERFAAWARETR
jgi:3-methyl-2-oxobutanoate hydroxymethyltransferase